MANPGIRAIRPKTVMRVIGTTATATRNAAIMMRATTIGTIDPTSIAFQLHIWGYVGALRYRLKCLLSIHCGRSTHVHFRPKADVWWHSDWLKITLVHDQPAQNGYLCVLLLDQAGWHGSRALVVPSNITLMPLPPKCPELNPVENVWQFMRDNWLSNRVF
jgi:hypothetical protein